MMNILKKIHDIFDYIVLYPSTLELKRLNEKWGEFNDEFDYITIEKLQEYKEWLRQQKPKHHLVKYELFGELLEISQHIINRDNANL